ncbi:MAG: flagellin [Xanthobacteraceae bacterium]|uniref:flagellin N-terminal helical domain-containing protein n=1 Tax=Pseudolabrys sp. TaxID=1960880 RepID=UPI003D13639E
MSSNITLSAGVRQNLLSLQDAASLIGETQNRLATGKKVNSALDNPGNFFTSQSLQNRASDLNGLLDAIGQAQQTLKAADQGITSITKLVESAKSIAKQAQQAPAAGSTTYSAITASGDPTNETLGTVTGAGLGATLGVGNGGNLVISSGGTDYTVALADGDDISTIVTKINAVTGAGGANVVTASDDGSGQLKLDAVTADVDFTVNASSDDVTTTALGLTEGAAHNSTSLLDSIGSSGQTLTIQVNGGANQVITFGTGAGEVSTLAELNTKLGTISGLSSASASNSAISLAVASTSSQNSIKLTTSNAGLQTALGLGSYSSTSGVTTQGTATVGTPDATRTSLEADYNNIISQIDTLAGDASYNGKNLLSGDDLKVVFNETGTSSLTISGVSFNSAGLGLSAVSSGTFQNNTNVDGVIGQLDTALTSLRTQASKFGSSLTTVQTRQDFTKNLITTLQTGADSLVLADTNLEGANLLALQTRQSLSSTALSLSAQADRAVLRLFGG